MSVDAGKLRQRVSFYEEGEIENESGGIEPGIPVLLKTVYAYVRPLSSREFFLAGQIQSELSHKITIRYDPSFTPTNETYVVYNNRRLEIVSVINIEERDEWYEILANDEGPIEDES